MSQIRTQLCYSVEEAAQALNLSETVLVRLSQYFKVPAAAYEEVGYLSFKGDLIFSEPDLAFFRQIKERLVAGDTLEQAKQKVPYGPPAGVQAQPQPLQEKNRTLREVQDDAPYQKAAERDFARYKSTHHTSISKVFSNMVKQVNANVSSQKKGTTPVAKPMRDKIGASVTASPTERLLPFRNSRRKSLQEEKLTKTAPPKTLGQNSAWEPAPEQNLGWEKLIQDALQRPRVLNQHLKAAALVLREQAMHQHRQTRN
jgi:hypothetical protein